MTTGSNLGTETLVPNTNTTQEVANRSINVTSTVAFQLIVNNTARAAAHYQSLFGATVISKRIIPGVANPADTNIDGNAADGSAEAYATRTVVIGNTAINLISRQFASNVLNVPESQMGDTSNNLPIVLTIHVDNVSLFMERATANNAEVISSLTMTDEGNHIAYIRGLEGYIWCLTDTMSINTAGGVSFTA